MTGRDKEPGEQRGIGFREKRKVETREPLCIPGKVLLSEHVLFRLHPALH